MLRCKPAHPRGSATHLRVLIAARRTERDRREETLRADTNPWMMLLLYRSLPLQPSCDRSADSGATPFSDFGQASYRARARMSLLGLQSSN
eukprot:COSAG02_NODE_999_length_15328_cov_8.086360_5_plen_91_part_00